ncbi:UNVERIFIED_CONTAM: hypothetical protein Slati_2888600 [Sesamum latifolium]|uniref:Reverse transcriptase domain-containing protein n=1 Tax=Sesamum latifolium TaxID=2727402 RepID=A0AAW2VD35_9LAMI
MNFTHVVLIPKGSNPECVSQLRPISLCNVVMKIVSKCIANRLKGLMDSLISPSQSAFIPGHLITDNVLLAFELNHFLKVTSKSKGGYVALKLDMIKAYDRVKWSFLRCVLVRIGFEQVEQVEEIQRILGVRTSVGLPDGLVKELESAITKFWLHSKQGWRVLSRPEALLSQVLKARYFPQHSFWEANLSYRPSLMWRSILATREVLRVGCGDHRELDDANRNIIQWKPSRNWLFSVRSAYNVVTDLEQRGMASSSRFVPFVAEAYSGFWRRL